MDWHFDLNLEKHSEMPMDSPRWMSIDWDWQKVRHSENETVKVIRFDSNSGLLMDCQKVTGSQWATEKPKEMNLARVMSSDSRGLLCDPRCS